ncbi:DUF3367 domain-containing protein [Corynebacterium auriscanis]|uniref:DUF3367 domain-containing protein n=1 Tax=Corynebacterium auriscanis TaxID=99807 RepID=UPI0024ACA395|nr:DUF3367 domain-containing protein [Corynebacterium auriscanis]
MQTLSKRAWILTTLAWFAFAFLQAPGLISADTKLDLTSDPWGFLAQALYPWTDAFPLGQLQNQAYGYLFPHGLFFALLSWLPGWIVQRLWWGMLLALAFAGTVKLLAAAGVGSRSSRVIAGVLFALSPRVLTTLGAISSEAWTVALVPWILLPMVRGFAQVGETAHAPQSRLTKTLRTTLAWAALSSAVAILCLGAVNAVATAAATLPAFLWWLAVIVSGRTGVASDIRPPSTTDQRKQRRLTRRAATYFALWWVPGGLLATFWWIGPLLILGRYSPPFTDYIESSSLTTRWLNPLEVLRGTTSWTPFLSTERAGGHALVVEPVFIVATLAVALLGLWGMRHLPLRWWLVFGAGFLVMVAAVDQFSPLSQSYRAFLDGPGAALRNLHKFDPLVRLPLVAGVAVTLRGIQWPGLDREKWTLWLHPEKHTNVPRAIAVGLLLAIVTATGWSGRIVAADAYRGVPSYWADASQWLNTHTPSGAPTGHSTPARTMILPEARFGRQTWGNTRDEPAQPWLDVPWVVRDSVPLVQPEAIRGLDGVQREVHSGNAIPSLAATLRNQGVRFVLVRSDLTAASDTPGPKAVLKTLQRSGGFREVAAFGDDKQVRIFQVGESGFTGGLRLVETENVEVVHAGPETLPRLDAADAALGRRGEARTRVLDAQIPQNLRGGGQANVFGPAQTVTDTPAVREHNYGNVVSADSEIRAPKDPTFLLNPMKDYPLRTGSVGQRESGSPAADTATALEPVPADKLTQVREVGGRVVASSSASDPTSFGGASTISSPTAAVDSNPRTAWRPAPGVAPGQWIEFRLDSTVTRPSLTIRTQGAPTRLQVTTFLHGKTVASTTTSSKRGEDNKITVPAGHADTIRLTIISAFGDFGLAEATVSEKDKDLTPRRIVTVPAPAAAPSAGSAAGAPGAANNAESSTSAPTSGVSTVAPPARTNRFVFGQEIPESTLIREFTVPGATDTRTPYVLHTDRCSSRQPIRATVDGREYHCGDVIQLAGGTHEVRSMDRWVALSIAEPLYAAAIANAPAGVEVGVEKNERQPSGPEASTPTRGKATAHTAPGRETADIAPADKPRIIYSPSQANPGRQATIAGHPGRLQPITVNGWQQGWIVPAGVGGQLTVEFAPTSTYRAWLAVGLIAATILVAMWVTLGASMRRRGLFAVGGAFPDSPFVSTPRSDLPRTPSDSRVSRLWMWVNTVIFGVSSAVALVLASQGPWGSEVYAGDQLATGAALGLAVLSALLRRFHHALIHRRAGSSTSA